MKLHSIQNKNTLQPNVTMKDIIIQQKDSTYGTTALDSVILNSINHITKKVTVTIKRQTSDFDKLVDTPAKRQSFIGRINDNLTQLFPTYKIDVLWLSGFDSNYAYTIH